MRPETLEVDLPAVRLSCLAWGPADGPLVVALHGFPDTAWTWRRVAPLLAEHGWRVAAPFLRGFAPSGIPSDGDYYVRVTDHLERGGPTFVYRIEVTASEPEVFFSSPEYSVNDTHLRQFAVVPRGGRYAAYVNVSRNNVSGGGHLGDELMEFLIESCQFRLNDFLGGC